MPLTEVEATAAVTCVSLHCCTCPAMLPRVTLPCDAPKPEPVNVIRVPGAPDAGLMLAICGVFTVNETALLMTPFCNTWALPDAAVAPTWATICVSLQLCTTAAAVPSHTWPLPCAAAKWEPAIVTVSPGAPMAGVTVEIVGVITLNGICLDQRPPCCTWALPD